MSGPAASKLEAYGVDALCEAILNGVTLTDIAAQVGVSIGSLLNWRDAVPERSARAQEARVRRAEMWDELAETEIRAATDKFELDKANSVAHHFRWRSSKISPAYREKTTTEVTGANGGPVQFEDVRAPIADFVAEFKAKRE